jgi:small subunit ribosomal protein S20
MPNTKQAKKRLVSDEARRLRNKVKRSAMRTAMKKVLRATTVEEGQQTLVVAQKRIDKAAKHNIIHANAAARYKQRLARRVAQLAG